MGHFIYVGHQIYIKVKYNNPCYSLVHLEICGVQQGCGGRLKVGFPSSGTCVQKWMG